MKSYNKMPVALCVAAALTLSSNALAGNGNNNGSQGDNNGKPFQELKAIIDDNRALIEANQDDIVVLKTAVSDLNSALQAVNQRIDSIESKVNRNSAFLVEVFKKVSTNTNNIAALRAELVSVHESVLGAIADIHQQMSASEQEIAAVLAQLNSATQALQIKMAALELTVSHNAVGVDGLQMQVVSLVSQVSMLNSSASTLTWQYNQMSGRVDQLEANVDEIAVVIANLGSTQTEDEPDDNGDGTPENTPCFSFTNGGSVDLTGNDWFDSCVAAEGENVKVVLKDNAGNVTYTATGVKNGAWTQSNITSTWPDTQHMVSFHDQLISLDNGDKLAISGKNFVSGGCVFDMFTGYSISIFKNSWGIEPIMAVMPYYRLGNPSEGIRGLMPWTSDREIWWDNGNSMAPCSILGNPTKGFEGSFEFYVYP